MNTDKKIPSSESRNLNSLPRSVESNRYLSVIICGLLALATFLVYLPVRNHEFLNWDDLTYVAGNDHVKGGATWEGIVWAFSRSYSANWHPLTWLSHMLDCQFFGLNAGPHHLINVGF